MRAFGPVGLGTLGAVLLTAIVVRTVSEAAPKAASKTTTRPAAKESAKNKKGSKMIYSESGYDITPLAAKRVEELAAVLTPEERDILLAKGTERPFCGALLDNKEEGTYLCRLCGLPLFQSNAKFHSGTGWPSFFQPFDKAHIREVRDTSHNTVRTETLCARCGCHLGHVFNDGPKPTGLRYCMNSGALQFYVKGKELPPEARPVAFQTAYFAGGCFWGVEDRLQQVPGVISAVSGYQGGTTSQPTYQQVCSHTTGHAESVRIRFDPKQIAYRQLLEWFFKIHDPTQLNRQGPDVGTQYRSAIFTTDDKQAEEAKVYIEELSKSDRFRNRKIVTKIEPAPTFYEAEEYHQDYHVKHGGSCPLPTN